MNLLDNFLDFLQNASLLEVTGLILVINLFEIVFVVNFGNWLRKIFSHRPIADPPRKTSVIELLLVASTLFINTFITIIGYKLWQTGYIVITNGNWLTMLLDMLIFILIIDLSMYTLHRIAHWEILFPWLHKTHHVYENPSPITLFLLNPIETLSFGSLWLLILVLYRASWPGVFLFLTFNLLFGMMGHLGVEPLSKNGIQKYFIKLFSTSTFHTMHHKTDRYNYGFYLIVWDKLFKTLHPNYNKSFKE